MKFFPLGGQKFMRDGWWAPGRCATMSSMRSLRRFFPDARRAPALVLSAALIVAGALAAPAPAALTLWPTCPAPPAGDTARCTSGAFPQSIIPGPDGAMWFTTARADLGRITAGGGFTLSTVPVTDPAGGLLGGLTVGPDSALWFTQEFGSVLWRATTAPAFAPTASLAGSEPRDVALGSDGALWLAESATETVGRYTPGGTFTHIALPPKPPGTFVSAFAIAAGPDGRLWIARPRSLAAVTTAGVVTDYPTPGAGPGNLAVGPDGALWFTAFAEDRVGRMTVDGTTTLFDLPAGTGPASIATGPDGALYVGLGKTVGGLMRLTTGGAWTLIPLLFSSQVSSVTTGPDGAVWFGDLGGSRIGRLDVDPGAGPAVLALSPSYGPAGTTVRVTGAGLAGATRVLVAGAAVPFTAAGSGLDVTLPAGAGGAAIQVERGGRRSPPTDAATFTFTTSGAALPVPVTATLPTVALGRATLGTGDRVTVTVQTTSPAPYDVAAALDVAGTGARIAAARGTLRIPRAGHTTGRLVRRGATRVRLRLTPAALRAVRRGTRLQIGVRLTLDRARTTVAQRSYRLRRP